MTPLQHVHAGDTVRVVSEETWAELDLEEVAHHNYSKEPEPEPEQQQQPAVEEFWEKKVLNDYATCQLMEEMFAEVSELDEDAKKAHEIDSKRVLMRELAKTDMEDWTPAQVSTWIGLMELGPDAEEVLDAVLRGCSGTDIKMLDDKAEIAKRCRNEGGGALGNRLEGGWEGVAKTMCAKRDEMVYLSEHLEEIEAMEAAARKGSIQLQSSRDLANFFDKMTKTFEPKTVAEAWNHGAIPIDKMGLIFGLGSKWSKKAHVGAKFADERAARLEKEEKAIGDLMASDMEGWTTQQVGEWCGLM